MRVLVTGSSGRLGGAIAELLRHRHQAVGLGRPAGVDGRGEPHAGRRRHRGEVQARDAVGGGGLDGDRHDERGAASARDERVRLGGGGGGG